MEFIDLNEFKNNGVNGPSRSGFSKTNANSAYVAAAIRATRALCGFDREDETTLGVLQYISRF